MTYVDWLFAYGHARVRNVDRACELAEAAPRRLVAYKATAPSEPVHAWVTSAFQACVRDAIDHVEDSGFPPRELASREGLDRVARYTVDKLLEHSWILGRGMTIDASGRFANPKGPPAERSALRKRIDALREAFDIGAALVPITEELSHVVTDQVVAVDTADALLDLVRVLGRSHREELAEVWHACEHASTSTISRLRVAYLAGLIAVRDVRAQSLQLDIDSRKMTLPMRLERARALAVGMSHLPTPERCAAIEHLAQGFDKIGDSSTSTYYCVPILGYVDSLIVGLVE